MGLMDYLGWRKMDFGDWAIALWFVGSVCGAVYVGNVETPNVWVLWLISLSLVPVLLIGLVFFLVILWVLVCWLLEKLMHFVRFLRRLAGA